MAAKNAHTERSSPERYEELRNKILARSDSLSKQLRLIAGYVLRHPDDVALESSYVVARRIGVLPSTLVRFAQAFDCSGYSEFQAVFRSRILERSLHLKLSAPEVASEGSAGTTRYLLHEISRACINALERIDTQHNADQLHAASEIISVSSSIYLLAQRRSFAISVYLQYVLSQIGVRAFLLDGVGGLLFDQVRSIQDGDAVIAISFHVYAPDVVEIVRALKKRKIPIIALTDGPLSPLVSASDVALQIEDAFIEGLPSITAMTCLAMSLVAAIMARSATQN